MLTVQILECFMIFRTLSLFALFATTAVCFVGNEPNQPSAPLSALQASTPEVSSNITEQQSAAARLMYGLLTDKRVAYTQRPLTDEQAHEVFILFAKSLDPQKIFLTQADLKELEPSSQVMRAAIEGKDLQPIMGVYSAWNAKAQKRVKQALALIDTGFSFDAEDTVPVRDRKTDWPKTEEDAGELLRTTVKGDWLQLKLAGQTEEAIRKTLLRRYSRMATNLSRLSSQDAVATFLNAYAATLDPHTNYFGPVDADTFNMALSLSMEGIGATLQEQDAGIIVRSLVAGSPAAESGQMKIGDRVVAVGQGPDGPMVDVVGWELNEVIGLIRGKKDTKVRLRLEQGGSAEPKIVLLTRQRVRLEDEGVKSRVVTVDGRKIGIVELPLFYLDAQARARGDKNARSASSDVAKVLEGFKKQGVAGVLVDLRGNGGGSLDEAIGLTGLFIDQGPVVQIKSADEKIEVLGDMQAGQVWAGPLAVLVDRNSASASEIFAAAIQDHGRGLILGETTYGKGTVQTVVNLDDFAGVAGARLGQVKLTIAQFFRINGHTTQHDGVTPDVMFDATLDGDKSGERELDHALPASVIPAARYKKASDPLVKGFSALQANHDQRAKTTPGLQWWEEDVREFRQWRDLPTLSLREATRRQELDARKAKVAARDAERKRLGLAVPVRPQDDGLTASDRSLEDQMAREAEAKKQPKEDPLLDEATHILTDAMTQ